MGEASDDRSARGSFLGSGTSRGSARDWVQAARLRTLPLAASCVMVGAAVAFRPGMEVARERYWWVFAGALLTVVLLQVTSNFSNDLGDAENGADDASRQDRAVASGRISAGRMRFAVRGGAVIVVVVGTATVWFALRGTDLLGPAVALVALGLAGVAAAYKYTAGRNPYGYKGLGDLAVMVFFGWGGVAGMVYLLGQSFHWSVLLPGTFVGAMSVAVLNLNNMRDCERDDAAGKRTLVVRNGLEWARRYHAILLIIGWVALFAFFAVDDAAHSSGTAANAAGAAGAEGGGSSASEESAGGSLWRGQIWYGLILLAQAGHLRRVFAVKDLAEFDPELKRVAVGTAVVALFMLLSQTNALAL